MRSKTALKSAPEVEDVQQDSKENIMGQSIRRAEHPARTDPEIAQAVRLALEWDVTVPEEQIRSTVANGVVTLEGTVSFSSQRADAERAVERLTGVKSVMNRIEIAPPEQVSIDDVRMAVKSALARHAEQDALRIDVCATDGSVNVSGIVHTWQERNDVVEAIRRTRGVRDVADHLRVQPHE
jgi:osmotically-inducible protein OsmY